MFAGIEAQDRRIWLVRPYDSSRGNDAVALYTASVSPWLFSRTFSSLKFRIRSYRLAHRFS